MLLNDMQQMPMLHHLHQILDLALILNSKLVLQSHRHPRDTAGIINFPYPCNAPFIVWSNIVNIIVNELICKINSPLLAFGNNKFKIGPANKHIPTVHGKPINIEINNENDVFLVIVLLSFFALAADIAGTNAVENATFIDNGKLVNISTFPPNIPYWANASLSGKNCFKLLTTVNESIFLLSDDIIAVNAIGVDTSNTFFIIFFTLSYL